MKFKINSIHPGKRGWKKCLGDLEAEIMELVWEKEIATVQDILDDICPTKKLAYTTVMTVMDRLAKKGLLKRKKDGRKYIYSPALTERELEIKLFDSLFSSLFKDWGRPALAHFIETISKEDVEALDELEKLIESKKQEYEKRIS